MKKANTNKKLIIVVVVLMLLSLCFALSFLSTNITVKAAPSAQSIINNTTYLGHNKAETTEYGRTLFANYFIHDGYWDDTTYEYGCVVFPVDYIDRFGFTDNYHARSEETGMQILSITGNKSYEVTGGYIYRVGVVNVNDSNVDRNLFFCFFVQNKATGVYTYGLTSAATYSKLTNNQSVDLTEYVSKETYNNARDTLQAQIDEYRERVEDLESALTDKGVDMTKFVTLAEHNAKVAELQGKINVLETQNNNQESKTEDGLELGQIIGICAGGLLVFVVLAICLSMIKGKHDYLH